jgi:transposase
LARGAGLLRRRRVNSKIYKQKIPFVLRKQALHPDSPCYSLPRQIKAIEEKRLSSLKLSWTSVEEEVARDFQVGHEYISTIRCTFIEDGDVAVFGLFEERGGTAPGYSHDKQTKIPAHVLISMASYIDEMHSKGASMTNRRLQNWLRDTYTILVSRRRVQRKLQRLGLSWSKVKPKKRSLNAYRLKAIRDYLIQHDILYKSILAGNSDYVCVFKDESYMHQTHSLDQSFLPIGDKAIERKSGKGRRLIILNAIATEGPLCKTDGNGRPIDDLKWKGDTCHPTERDNRKLTCETLWFAQSHTGDYHDNMNSEMFMQWVEDKLVPVFERKYPGKKMVLLADNAPYHHKRVIGSLASLSKKKIADIMVEHEVETIDLPINDKRIELLRDGRPRRMHPNPFLPG